MFPLLVLLLGVRRVSLAAIWGFLVVYLAAGAVLYEQHPGSKYGDHARGNDVLRAELKQVFLERSTDEWVRFGDEHNTPIAPVNTPKTIADDPQFQDRLPWIPKEILGADQVPTPLKFLDSPVPVPTKAPTPGQDTDDILSGVLGYDAERITALREAGALG